MSSPLIIDYYTDILCVWGWIAQRRNEELLKQFGNKIDISYHYIDVFGDAATKIPTQWSERGGYDGFSAHVLESAKPFESAIVNADVWSKVRPMSSANTHLVLKAIELAYSKQHSIEFALKFRKAFFVDAQDISNIDVLLTIITQESLDCSLVNQAIANGSAMASLMKDYQQAKTLGLKGSPTYIMNSGRQTLHGNVGYRLLSANINELLNKSKNDASWC